MKTKLTLIWLVLIVALTPIPVHAQDPYACDDDGIYLYEGTNYQGRCVMLTQGLANLDDLTFNDQVSSVRMVGSYGPWLVRALLCEHAFLEGRCSPFFIGDDPDLHDNNVGNDRTSSIEIENIQYGESVHIDTSNAQAFPLIFFISATHDGCCEDIPDRIRKFAERIIASNYDVFALEEIFDNDVRDELISRLKEYYPFYVSYLDAADFDEDSGLMLFSKFPFVELPQNTYEVCEVHQPHLCDNLVAVNGAARWYDVAFIEYTEFDDDGCNGYFENAGDCWANKGVAYVRIMNPRSGRIYNVVFTHMDASGSSGDLRARELNFEATEVLIRGTMTDEQINSEDIFMLGDLNVNGNLAGPRGEWDKYFNNQESFFTNTLHDVWEYEMQPGMPSEIRDRGLTGSIHDGNPEGGSRPDYFLRNTLPPDMGGGPLCVQHMTVAYNLRYGEPYVEGGRGEAGVQDLSDHYGLNADLNLQAPYCSPASAKMDLPFDQWFNGQITYPGSMQWFHFKSPGTYSISLRSDGPVDFQVYKSTDLSSPIARHGEPARSWTFNLPAGHPPEESLPDNEFYIRVFARDRAWSGAYQMIVHQHNGSNPTEAIVLFPNQPIRQPFGETTWFRFMTEAPDSGQAQELKVFVKDSVSPVNIELRAADTTTLIASSSPGITEILRSDIADNNQQMFLLVKGSQPSEYEVGWTTNLTVLHGTLAYPLKMRCDEQTSDEGVGIGEDDDNVRMTIEGDGQLLLDSRSLGDFDEGQVRGLGDVFTTIRFLDQLNVKLVEEDGGLHFGDDILTGIIQPLPVPHPVRFPISGDGGVYHIFFNRSHGLEFGFPSEVLVVNAGPDQESAEGDMVELSEISFIDYGIADVYTSTIDWGDGSPIEVGIVEAAGGEGRLHFNPHTYGDNGIFTVKVCVTADGVRTACDTLNLTVSNVAPSANIDSSASTLINGIPTFFTHAGMPIDFTGHSTDPGSDDLVLRWDWGDGSPISEIVYLVNPPDPDLFPSPSIQPRDVMDPQTHTFALAYLYTIKFWAEDDDGGVSPVDSAVVIVTGNAGAGQSKPTGYWQHQFRQNGRTDLDEPTLMGYLAINDFLSAVFNEARDASTIASAYDVLFMKQNQGDAKEQFDRELLTVWLNFANGSIEYAAFSDVTATAEAVRLDPNATEAEIRDQKNILHQTNH